MPPPPIQVTGRPPLRVAPPIIFMPTAAACGGGRRSVEVRPAAAAGRGRARAQQQAAPARPPAPPPAAAHGAHLAGSRKGTGEAVAIPAGRTGRGGERRGTALAGRTGSARGPLGAGEAAGLPRAQPAAALPARAGVPPHLREIAGLGRRGATRARPPIAPGWFMRPWRAHAPLLGGRTGRKVQKAITAATGRCLPPASRCVAFPAFWRAGVALLAPRGLR
jgi:hypothetical protein